MRPEAPRRRAGFAEVAGMIRLQADAAHERQRGKQIRHRHADVRSSGGEGNVPPRGCLGGGATSWRDFQSPRLPGRRAAAGAINFRPGGADGGCPHSTESR